MPRVIFKCSHFCNNAVSAGKKTPKSKTIKKHLQKRDSPAGRAASSQCGQKMAMPGGCMHGTSSSLRPGQHRAAAAPALRHTLGAKAPSQVCENGSCQCWSMAAIGGPRVPSAAQPSATRRQCCTASSWHQPCPETLVRCS